MKKRNYIYFTLAFLFLITTIVGINMIGNTYAIPNGLKENKTLVDSTGKIKIEVTKDPNSKTIDFNINATTDSSPDELYTTVKYNASSLSSKYSGKTVQVELQRSSGGAYASVGRQTVTSSALTLTWNDILNQSKNDRFKLILYVDNVETALRDDDLNETITISVARKFIFEQVDKQQLWTAPTSGEYRIELWGAAGNYHPNAMQNLVGNGSYTAGKINLEAGKNLYFYIGKNATDVTETNDYTGPSYNGGGKSWGVDDQGHNASSGGGASDVRYFGEHVPTADELKWDSDIGLNSRIMVAAGGGGAHYLGDKYGVAYQRKDIEVYGIGGAGGGLFGHSGSELVSYPTTGGAAGELINERFNYQLTFQYNSPVFFSTGGTQSSGGLMHQIHDANGPAFVDEGKGEFGYAASKGGYSFGNGGGGYYGGGSGGSSDLNNHQHVCHSSGAGGSSYISGFKGSIAITAADDRTPKCTQEAALSDASCSIHYSNYSFTDTVMIDGDGYNWNKMVSTQYAKSAREFLGWDIQVTRNIYEGFVNSGYSTTRKNLSTKDKDLMKLMPKYGSVNGTYELGEGNTTSGRARITYLGSDKEAETVLTETGALQIVKKDQVSNQALAGAKFMIYNADGTTPAKHSNGNSIGEVTTDSNGIINIDDLEKGTYIIKETQAPTNYIITKAQESVTIEQGKTSIKEIGNEPLGKIVISKVDDVDGTLKLQGATFELLDSNDTKVTTNGKGAAIGNLVTDASGSLTIPDLRYGVYTLKEIKAPIGYQITQETTKITVNQTATPQAVVIKNTPLASLKIIKIDKETNQRLPGVEFELYRCSNQECKTTTKVTTNGNGDALGTIKTNSAGEIKVDNLLFGYYIVKETKYPNGYVITSPDTKVTIDRTTQDSNRVVTITVNNTPIEVSLYKKDFHTKQPLAGATITIADISTGDLYQEFITDKDVFKLRLVPGEYKLTESIAPAGYAVHGESINISVSQTGIITLISAETDKVETGNNTITIFNERTTVRITKKDITDGSNIAGAEFEMLDVDGEIVKDAVTDEEIKFTSTTEDTVYYLLPGEYQLKEIKAPEGASLACEAKVKEYQSQGYKIGDVDCTYQLIEDPLNFKMTDTGNVEILGDDNEYYFLESNRVVVYNGSLPIPVPDTGAFVSIITILVGAALVYVGYIFIKKKKA